MYARDKKEKALAMYDATQSTAEVFAGWDIRRNRRCTHG